MTIAMPVVLGVMLALALAAFANRRSAHHAVHVYATALIVAALIYVAFALIGRASGAWLLVEVGGVALFGAAAVVGRRTWVPCLAIGWAAHVAWDLALHRRGAGAVYTPVWYPWLCVGFDLTLAAYILALGVEECNEHIDRCPDTVEGSRGLFAEDTGVCRPTRLITLDDNTAARYCFA